MPFLSKDAALLKRFRRGDPAALEKVYWAYVDQIERVVRHGFQLLRGDGFRVAGAHRDEVADLLQEVFARAFAERARLAYDGLRDYTPFLITIARNLMVDRARKSGREVSLDTLGERDEPASLVEEPYADDQTLRVVQAYVAGLSPELKGVHEQRFVHGVSQDEAARALSLSRQQIRTLERRLREGLIQRMQEAGIPMNQPVSSDPRMEGERKAK